MEEQSMGIRSLSQVVQVYPFPDYAEWWVMGKEFLRFMSGAIISEWKNIPTNMGTLSQVQSFVTEYIRTVYKQAASPSLVERFHHQDFSQPIHSGEFDALSYAFYRSAFELLAQKKGKNDPVTASERRLFTKRVGKSFFSALHDHLNLNMPPNLNSENNFTALQENIRSIGEFLVEQGYLRDHFAFSFDVDVRHAGKQIHQTKEEFLHNLQNEDSGYALYTMGYPAILPSAVYLFHTHGEAQHHSSRTIEELFDLIGYQARETDDFDPTGFPSDKVVELWEILAK
jgi:hypothetical protein